MSLSSEKGAAANVWGTIYAQGREHRLDGMERDISTAWTPADEAAYLDRVRQRAGHMAARIVAEARREGENIRRAAREEGYARGLEDAKTELEQFRAGMGDAAASVLGAIEEQRSRIFAQWREDLVALARLAVEKISGVELRENRRVVLDSLLRESVSVLERSRELVIRVHAEDEPMLADIVSLAKERYPDIRAWRVKADASITPGGMVVESDSSLAEGRVESRRAAVEKVLSRLVLPDDPAMPPPAAQAPVPEAERPAHEAPGAVPLASPLTEEAAQRLSEGAALAQPDTSAT